MSVLRVLAPGFLTTVQDLGRYGHGEDGVSAAGAADSLALRLGNRLLGNPEGASALEMTLTGGRFLFERAGVGVLAGSDFGATLDGVPTSPWACFEARPGQTLALGPTREGARVYLCLRGGIDVPSVLGSASTHLLTKIGGIEGRALRTGDALAFGGAAAAPSRAVPPERLRALRGMGPLRFTPGPQANWFDAEAHARLGSAEWAVEEGSDRVGLRLAGPLLPRHVTGELPTEGVSLGAIQVPRCGGPIVLFVDHQTTGGYPKIANIIAVDLPRLGQLRPRDVLRLEPVGFEEARALLLRREEELHALLG